MRQWAPLALEAVLAQAAAQRTPVRVEAGAGAGALRGALLSGAGLVTLARGEHALQGPWNEGDYVLVVEVGHAVELRGEPGAAVVGALLPGLRDGDPGGGGVQVTAQEELALNGVFLELHGAGSRVVGVELRKARLRLLVPALVEDCLAVDRGEFCVDSEGVHLTRCGAVSSRTCFTFFSFRRVGLASAADCWAVGLPLGGGRRVGRCCGLLRVGHSSGAGAVRERRPRGLRL